MEGVRDLHLMCLEVEQVEGELCVIFNLLMGSYREDRDIIPKLHSERMRGNSCLLQ